MTTPLRMVVAGSTGFLGKPLCRALARAGHEVTALARNTRRAAANLPAAVKIVEMAAPYAAFTPAMRKKVDILGITRTVVIARGLGWKDSPALWEKLGISTVGELEYACRENRLVALEGFGLKTQEKILQGIALRKRYSEMHLYSDALAGARDAIRALEATGLFEKASIAGSLRRGKARFKDVDVVLVPAAGVRAEAAAAAGLDKNEIYTAADATEASAVAKKIIRKGDWVLIKGSRAMGLEAVAEAIR